MSPELRRNLWLELSPLRLALTPVLLVLLLVLVSADEARPWPTIYTWAAGIFIVVVHFWGTRKASESVSEEVRDRTWDWQRLSSLRPAQMAFGKLFGATAFTWYAGAFCLAIMALGDWADVHLGGTAALAAVMVASAVALHAVALAGSLQASRKDAKLGSRIGTILLIPVALVVTGAYLHGGSELERIAWYGGEHDGLAFIAASTGAAAAWALLAAQREMSRELKVPGFPWAYPAFAIFLGAYLAGFTDGEPVSATGVVFQVVPAAVALAYYGIFADVTNVLTLRRLVLHARAWEWRRAVQALPLWATALGVCLAFALAATALADPFGDRGQRTAFGLPPLAMALTALRDAGILAFFALSPRARRPEGSALLAIALLSWLLPGLLVLTGLEAAAHALLPFTLPASQAIGIVAVHVTMVFALVAWRWRRVERALERPGAAETRGV